jgi:hypothetical protein
MPIRLDWRSAQMPIEDCFRRFELDALVLAVQQLASGRKRFRDLSHVESFWHNLRA